MGKKDNKEMASQRDIFISGAVERGIAQGDAEAIFEACAKFAEYGFNKSHSAPYALLDLSDRLHEGELSGRVSGRLDDARHGQHRQARRIPRRGGAAWHQGRAAVDQPLRRRVRRRRQHHLLRAGGAARRRPPGGREHRRGARRARRSPISPTSPAASIRARSTSACWKASSPPAPSTPSSRTARASSPPSTRMLATAQRAHEDAAIGQSELFGGAARPSR